jgi:hypothetical protein
VQKVIAKIYLKHIQNNANSFRSLIELLFYRIFDLLKNYKIKEQIRFASKSLCSGIDVIFPYVKLIDPGSREVIRRKMWELLKYFIDNNLKRPFENEVLVASFLICSKTNYFDEFLNKKYLD